MGYRGRITRDRGIAFDAPTSPAHPTSSPSMKILVTGSSGCIAAALLPMLCTQPFVASVTGVDWKPGNFTHDKFMHIPLDMRDAQLKDVMAGHDAVVHLGFVVA